jgi:NAD(P)-dependent dehydrogenase (short-subunit alcohol dehydrogenase family)
MSGLRDLSGKVAVVTGGASGIGRGIATELLKQRMRVVIADIEEDALEKTGKAIGASAGIVCDVSDRGSVEALAKEVQKRFGMVHVLVNNAGVGPMGPISTLSIEDWTWVLGVNLWGVIHGVHAFLPILKANKEGGHIVNTASLAGLIGLAELGPYCVSKHGVVALTETLAQELAQEGSKVGASVLCPGTVATNIQNSSRNRPAKLSKGALKDVDLRQDESWGQARFLEPDQVGTMVVKAIESGDLYIMTHPEFLPPVEQRFAAIRKAFQEAG